LVSDRSADWLSQAERDLRHACNARDDSDHEWACFAAQQAAEKAVKALALALGGEPWGHSVTSLLAALPQEQAADSTLIDRAKVLDKHYIQPRYPNGFDSGAPGDYYTLHEADAAIGHAEAILAHCRDKLRRPGRGA
jgi:HEPN domain-containing protein